MNVDRSLTRRGIPLNTEREGNTAEQREATIKKFMADLTANLQAVLSDLKKKQEGGYSEERIRALASDAHYDFAKVEQAIRTGEPLVFRINYETNPDSYNDESSVVLVYATLAATPDGQIVVSEVHTTLEKQMWPTTRHQLEQSSLNPALFGLDDGHPIDPTDFFGVKELPSKPDDDSDNKTTYSRSLYAAQDNFLFEDTTPGGKDMRLSKTGEIIEEPEEKAA